jgi:transmembrane sensor
MENCEKRVIYLLERYENGAANQAEMDELFSYFRDADSKETANNILFQLLQEQQPSAELNMANWMPIVQKILQNKSGNTPYKRPVYHIHFLKRGWMRYAAAAAILVFLIAGSYFLLFNKNNHQQSIAGNHQQIKDLPPGKNSAILTLADGKQIILDTAKGTISKQGNTTIINLSGLLSYQSGENKGEVLYNTVTTARGNQYQLVLPDGSKVWLNSASSLHFPTLFTGNERRVDLDGEGYFEIAHNPLKPFHVIIRQAQDDKMDVEALGTHFNVNSYKDEKDIKTTLFEGAVRIYKQGKMELLKPGQEAIADDFTITVNKDIDLNKVLAWKNGWFEFDNTDLPTIMRQISRWYDVDIAFEGKPTSETFGGRISKNLQLSRVLHSLESNRIKFRLEGKKLYVNP